MLSRFMTLCDWPLNYYYFLAFREKCVIQSSYPVTSSSGCMSSFYQKHEIRFFSLQSVGAAMLTINLLIAHLYHTCPISPTLSVLANGLIKPSQ